MLEFSINLMKANVCGIVIRSGCFLFVVLVVAYLYSKLFHGLYELKMDCTNLGFEKAGRVGFDETRKRQMVNEKRRRKRECKNSQIFPNGWFAILQTNQLLKSKSREINVLGLNLVAWRGTSGSVHVADAYCPHLGAHLGVSSRVLGDCIECPFHSWCFDGKENGKLVNAPYSKNETPARVNLKMWDTTEVDGTIYLWYHSEKKPPTWYPDGEGFIDEKRWKCRSIVHIQMGCLVQDITENGADLTHFNELHTDFSWLTGDMKSFRWLRRFCRHMHKGDWKADPVVKHIARVNASQWLLIIGGFSCMHTKFESVYYGPGILHVTITTPSAVFKIIQTHTPREFMSMDYTARIYTLPWVPALILKSVTDIVANQVTRDVRVLNRKANLKKPRLLPEDIGVKRFRHWYNQFYSNITDPSKSKEDSTGQELL